MYITIEKIDDYLGTESYKINQELILIKDKDNIYDDEAIKVITENNATCGYVANSVEEVARGTHSAGYIYNLIEEKQKCTISFILENKIIASFNDAIINKQK